MIRPILATAALISMLALPAGAAVLPVDATLRVDILTLSEEFPIGSAQVTTTPGNSQPLLGLTVPTMALGVVSGFVDITDPDSSPAQGLQLTFANQAGSFTRPNSTQALTGTMPLAGTIRICLFADCSGFVPANLSLPLDVIGVGGVAYATETVGTIAVTVQGAPWIAGTTEGTFTTPGGTFDFGEVVGQDAGLFGPGTNGAGTATATLPGGRVSLVSPIFISTNIGGGQIITGAATLNLLFVPEPGVIALQGSAIVALLLMGWRRLSR